MRADRVVIEPFAYDSIGELEIKKEIVQVLRMSGKV